MRRATEKEDEEDEEEGEEGVEDEDEDEDVRMKEGDEGSCMYILPESSGQNSVYILPDDNNDGIPFLEVIEEEIVVEDGPQYEVAL